MKLLSQMTDDERDRYVLSLEKRIADLEGKLAAISPDDMHRACFVHKQLTEMTKAHTPLRNAMTLIEQVQHCLNQQSVIEAQLREIKRMVGVDVAAAQEDEADRLLREAMGRAGKSKEEIDAIMAQRGKV